MASGGLIFHSKELLLITQQARDRARESAEQHPGVLAWDATIAIVMAAAAAEAFINELGAVARMADGSDPPPLSEITVLGEVLGELEDSQGRLTVKFLMASHVLGAPFRKGEAPFQDFDILVKLRNSHLHLQPVDPAKDPGRYLGDLRQRGLTYPLQPGEGMSWLSQTQTAPMADWAFRSSLHIIRSTLAKVPDPRPGLPSPMLFLRHGFSPDVFGP